MAFVLMVIPPTLQAGDPAGLVAAVRSSGREYIAAVRAHIMKMRGDRMKEFTQVTHPGQIDYQ